MRRIVFVLTACLALAGRAAEAPAAIDSKGPLTFDEGTGIYSAKEDVRFSDEELAIRCDEATYDRKNDVATATGHVVATFTHRGGARLLADRLVYNRKTQHFTADNVRFGSYPYFVEAFSADGTPAEVTLTRARVSYGEPGPWQPTWRADRVTVLPGHEIRSENSQLGIGHIQPFPVPRFRQEFAAPIAAAATLAAGFRHSLGAFVDVGLRVPVAPELRVGGDVGLYTSRGLLVGPGARYGNPEDPDKLSGFFRSGYIHDYGNRGTDLLGHPVPIDRAYAEWQHRQTLAENLTLTAQLNWWKDSEVLRDFRPREFFPVQQPDTFVESVYTGPNYFVSAFGRFQPNRFQRIQQRLPEVRFGLLPTAINGGAYERFEASAAVLREDPLRDEAFPKYRSTRYDAYYSLERPWAPNDWFAFTPVAGGRFTYYENPREQALQRVVPIDPGTPFVAGSPLYGSSLVSLRNYTRTLGEVGFDTVLRGSGTFDYKNPAWKIDGLRHLVTPRLSYRYIPGADKGMAQIPPIDRQVFTTYLQPLGLGDTRNIDDLRPTNTLRFAIDNVLQTRDGKDGTRDLASLTLADDFRFKRRRGERDVSLLQSDFALTPARWIALEVFQSFAPRELKLREFNTALTLRDGNAWSVRFANNFLRPAGDTPPPRLDVPGDLFPPRINDYLLEGRARINEVFEAITRLNFDARRHRFNEQSYGIVQNVGNTWFVSYNVTLYEGRRRESRFGFSLQVDTVRF